MTQMGVAPTRAEALRLAILDRYESLSKRLQQIARYVHDLPNALALETLVVLAARCDVQPSAVVRFAKSFGFRGVSQMQRLFRDGLRFGNAALGYGERVRQFSRSVDGKEVGDPSQVLAELVAGTVLTMQTLASELVNSVMKDLKLIVVVLGNHGYGCILRLQHATGSAGFNRLLADPAHRVAPKIDFAAHAASLDAPSEHVGPIGELEAALLRARAAAPNYVMVVDTDPLQTTEAGGCWWGVVVS